MSVLDDAGMADGIEEDRGFPGAVVDAGTDCVVERVAADDSIVQSAQTCRRFEAQFFGEEAAQFVVLA